MKESWINIHVGVLVFLLAGHVFLNNADSNSVMPSKIEVQQPDTGKEFAQQVGCFKCHLMEEVNIGPSFNDIAQKYNMDNRDTLIGAVKNGTKGKWPEVSSGGPMPPYSNRLKNEEIERLVDWILNL